MPKPATLATLGELVQGGPMASDQDRAFMREAIKVMRDAGLVNKTGGPFGAVIVKDGQVIAAAGNSVIKDNDPSAHSEVNAIRQVFHAASWSDYDDLFSDRAINDDIRRPMPEKEIPMQQILQREAQAAWAEFRRLPDGARY